MRKMTRAEFATIRADYRIYRPGPQGKRAGEYAAVLKLDPETQATTLEEVKLTN